MSNVFVHRPLPDPSPFTSPAPPTAPPPARRRWLRWAILGALIFVGTLGSLSMVFGGDRLNRISGGGMVPAVAAGDRVVTEGLTYLFRKPRRGEISLDSRQWGAIPSKNITGRGWFVMTPSDGFHTVR